MMNWRETCAHMDRLIATNAPPSLKAHWIVTVLLPRLIAQIGIEPVGHELAHLLMRGLCYQSGTCTICKTKRMDGVGADADDLCCKCRAQMDQIIAEAGIE